MLESTAPILGSAGNCLTLYLHPQLHPHVTAAGGDLREYQMSGLRWMEGCAAMGLTAYLLTRWGWVSSEGSGGMASWQI
jgi:hypothetical protein